jgi:hypothetical protein
MSALASFGILTLLLLIAIVVALIIVAVKYFGKRRTDDLGVEVVSNAGGFRRGVVRVAEFAAVVTVISLTIAGAVTSGFYSYIFGAVYHQDLAVHGPSLGGILFGGMTGFLSGALITAPVFALSLIEKNTHRTAVMLELLARPRS